MGKITKKTFLKNTIDIWYRAHQYMGGIPPISPFSPIWGNTGFKAGRADGGFKIWADKGVQKLADLYKDGNFLHLSSYAKHITFQRNISINTYKLNISLCRNINRLNLNQHCQT